jgi:osmotically-inducible protein OsmY
MTTLKATVHAFAFVVILASALPGCATYNNCGIGGCTDDAKITANVQALFVQYAELGPPNLIDVQTVDQVVYLNGLVGEGLESSTAESVALQAPGVKRVVNSIAVSH